MEDEPCGTSILFSPVYGASSHAALCYVLQVNGITLLLDCGWTDGFDTELLAPLELQADSVQAVLLSHASLQHLGALPYLLSKLQCKADVLATRPVQRMGQLNMYDALTMQEATRDVDAINLDDVDFAFDRVTTLSFLQRHTIISPDGEPLVVTPYPAGHDLGGTIWSIQCGAEEVVYASDWTQRTDGHVAGADISRAFYRPSLFIADAWQRGPVDFEQRNTQFLQCVLSVLRADGNVLIPCDTTGRCLELVKLLEHQWAKLRLPYGLALCTSVALTTLDNAKAMMEWMKESLLDDLHQRENPWTLRHVRLIASVSDVAAMGIGPKVVLASLPSLSAGPARELLAQWAGDPHSAVVMPGTPQAGSLAEALALAGQGGDPTTAGHTAWRRQPGGRWEFDLTLSRRIPLTEEEIAAQEQAAAALVGEEEAMEADTQQGAAEEVGAIPSRASSQVIGKLIGGDVGAPQLLGPPRPSTAGPQAEDALAVADTEAGTAPGGGVLLDGFEAPAGAAHPLYPFEDEEEEGMVDEYGAELGPRDFAQDEGDEAMLAFEELEAEAGEAPPPPTKIVSHDTTITLAATVHVFDFDNLVDSHSLAMFLQSVAPRHLVLVAAPPTDREALAARCMAAFARGGVDVAVHAPNAGDVLDCSAPTLSQPLLLHESLTLGLRRQGPRCVTWVSGTAEGEVAPLRLVGTGRGGEGGLFIGEAKLSSAKAAMDRSGIAAEFARGGALVCAGGVKVLSTAGGEGVTGGELLLEGPLSSDFFAVRQAIYSMYHIC